MRKLLQYFKELLTDKCAHNGAKTKNCKYCPDCGKKVEFKWVTVKCDFCGHYRKPVTDWQNKLKPEKKYCFYCGSDNWSYQNYYESNIPDRMKTIAVKKIAPDKEYKFGSLTCKTKVWISKPTYDRKV